MATRRNTEPALSVEFKKKEKPGNLNTVTAGINRSGLRRVGQRAAFESSEEPPAVSLQTSLSVNLPVLPSLTAYPLLPPPGLSNESVSDQLVEGSNNSVCQGQVQCLVDSDADSTHTSDYITVIMAGEGNSDLTDNQ